MQMFVLDQNPAISARCLCDAHIRVIGREISMCLSSWYAQHIGHADELPYKEFNHPIVTQFDNEGARFWAVHNATFIFAEFERRFGKQHASELKFGQLLRYRCKYHDAPLSIPYRLALFSFVEKGTGVVTCLPIKDAVQRYRQYYRNKVNTMRVPVVWTATERPDWLEESR